MPSWKYPKEQERPKFAQLVIPTLDSVRYEKLLTLAYSVQKVRDPSVSPSLLCCLPPACVQHGHKLCATYVVKHSLCKASALACLACSVHLHMLSQPAASAAKTPACTVT